jgi:hypothetical protein
VGDVAPFTADTIGSFGDGTLNILDLIQVLFAVNNVPGFQPTACSDRFDAMDLYPVDTGATRGGDGVLDIRDLIRELFRVNNLDTDRPQRSSRNGVCPTTTGPKVEASRIARDDADGALVLGDPDVLQETERTPLYLEAQRDLVRVAATLAVGDQLSQLRFTATPSLQPSIVQDSQKGVVAVAWLDGVNVRAGERLLLGYVTRPAGGSPDLTVYGLSAVALDGDREVRLNAPTSAGRKSVVR